MARLDILKQSLKNKEDKFNEMINSHFSCVKSANGQPLNDKRNGAATLRKWDKQNNALENQQKEIEKTKEAILKEENKIRNVKEAKTSMPTEITDLIKDGVIKQWRKYPNIMFVNGVDKARIIWDEKKRLILHKYVDKITDKDQRVKFARIYNDLNKKINIKNN